MTSIQSTSSAYFNAKAIDLMNRRSISSEDRQTFQNILEQNASIAPQDAVSTLKDLSSDEMEVLRQVHCLADPIQINRLNEEGAYNLLRQPGNAADLNNDSFTQIGAGLIKPFPPPNAPAEVKEAWESAMAGKSETEKMLLQMSFAPMELAANTKYNASGQVIGFYSPGEEGFTNIYAQPGFTYTGLIDRYLKYLENFKSSIDIETYQKQKSFMLQFQAALKDKETPRAQ